MRTHWCNFILVSYTVFIFKKWFCHYFSIIRGVLGQKLTSPLLEKLTLYIADEERQRGREKDRGTFVMTDKKFFFSWNSFYIHFKTLKKHYTVINIMPPIMYYFKGFFYTCIFFLLLYFFWKVYTKIKNRFSENNYKTNLVFFYYITFEWSPEGDMIEK